MLLLQHGAAVDTTTKDMYTALHIAAKEGQEEVMYKEITKIADYISAQSRLHLFWTRHREYLM